MSLIAVVMEEWDRGLGEERMRPVEAEPCHEARYLNHALLLLLVGILVSTLGTQQSRAQQAIDLTLESAVDLAMGESYRVRQLQLGIEETRNRLRAERAGLKSQVYMNLITPQIAALSDHKWNSDLHRNETIRENTRTWQMDFSIKQPVILFGFPTNGYLSLNNRVYRYAQLNGERSISYYNRYFVKFEQPLFQPNELKNDIEEAELNLDEVELEFQEDVIDLMDDIADDYYSLFELSYERVIQTNLIGQLTNAEAVAREIVAQDTSRAIELSQIQVELANAREQLNQSESEFRLEASRMKQRLRLNERDSLLVSPVLNVVPVQVDVAQAIEFGKTLRPRLQRLAIWKRKEEIDLENTKGAGGFRANLEMTYGREMEEPHFTRLWDEPTNSYSVGFRAYVPIWDWGRRKARIQAEQLSVQQAELSIEEAQQQIESEIVNAVQNLDEYEKRATAMQNNLAMAEQISEQSLARYRNGVITVMELLQSFRRQADTAENFLEAYLGYRQAILSLQEYTYYDFENDMPVLRRFEMGMR